MLERADKSNLGNTLHSPILDDDDNDDDILSSFSFASEHESLLMWKGKHRHQYRRRKWDRLYFAIFFSSERK